MQISMLGLWKADNTVWDDMVVPSGVDKSELTDYIMLETCDLEILYPDPVIMKSAIKLWSKQELPSWTKLYATETATYDPLLNTNITETQNRGQKDTSERNTTTETSSESDVTSDGTNTEKANSFNSPEMVDNTQNVTHDVTGTETTTSTNGTDVYEGQIAENITRNRKGFSGLTAQELVKAQREVAEFCIEDVILKSFKRRFCLLVY